MSQNVQPCRYLVFNDKDVVSVSSLNNAIYIYKKGYS